MPPQIHHISICREQNDKGITRNVLVLQEILIAGKETEQNRKMKDTKTDPSIPTLAWPSVVSPAKPTEESTTHFNKISKINDEHFQIKTNSKVTMEKKIDGETALASVIYLFHWGS